MTDTIYALSSGIGRAGVAVIRVSGPAVPGLPAVLADCRLEPRVARLVRLKRPASGEIIDYGLIVSFPAPRSFTGEDVLELHVHGGRAVVAAVLDTLSMIRGLRAAEPGEFTRRAFSNGKLDLASAEGLADLIDADTELQRRRAVRQFTGAVGEQCRLWRSTLVDSLALIEACLDFPDEGEIPGDVTAELAHDLGGLLASFEDALASRQNAEIVRGGAVVLIAGRPNSGKSTLLNRIARRDVAIISEIPGTTRDLIEITVDLRGLPVTFIDSAGIRATPDPIEMKGISKTLERAETAHLVLWLSPADQPDPAPALEARRVQVVTTKPDLIAGAPQGLSVSGVTGEGLDQLLDFVYESLLPGLGASESPLLSSQRQFERVSTAAAAIRSAQRELGLGRLELVAEEIRAAARSLEELTGSVQVEDVLDEVFGRFCLGK